MKKLEKKLAKARSVKVALKLLRSMPRGSGAWHSALQKLRVLVREELKKAMHEGRCMRILASVPISGYDGEFRSAAVARMLSLCTFGAYKCAYIIAKPGSESERRALEGMLATAKSVEEFEIVMRLAPNTNKCKAEAHAHIVRLREHL